MRTSHKNTVCDGLMLGALFAVAFATTLAFRWPAQVEPATVPPVAMQSLLIPVAITQAMERGMEVPEESTRAPTLDELASSGDSSTRAEAQALQRVLAEESQNL